MTIKPAVLQGGAQIGAAATVLYTCPANTTAVVKRAVFTNTDSSARALTVYVVRSGGSPGVTNTVISGQVLSAGQAYAASELSNLVLSAGDSVQALSDVAAKVNAVISGFTA